MRKFRQRYRNCRTWGFPRNQAFTIALMALWDKHARAVADTTIGDTALGIAFMLSALSETVGKTPLDLLNEIMANE